MSEPGPPPSARRAPAAAAELRRRPRRTAGPRPPSPARPSTPRQDLRPAARAHDFNKAMTSPGLPTRAATPARSLRDRRPGTGPPSTARHAFGTPTTPGCTPAPPRSTCAPSPGARTGPPRRRLERWPDRPASCPGPARDPRPGPAQAAARTSEAARQRREAGPGPAAAGRARESTASAIVRGRRSSRRPRLDQGWARRASPGSSGAGGSSRCSSARRSVSAAAAAPLLPGDRRGTRSVVIEDSASADPAALRDRRPHRADARRRRRARLSQRPLTCERCSRRLTNAGGERTSRSVAEILRANIFTRFDLLLGVLAGGDPGLG